MRKIYYTLLAILWVVALFIGFIFEIAKHSLFLLYEKIYRNRLFKK